MDHEPSDQPRYPTLDELKRMYDGEHLECPKCGCRAWKTVSTWDNRMGRRRKKACLSCGNILGTIEIPLSEG